MKSQSREKKAKQAGSTTTTGGVPVTDTPPAVGTSTTVKAPFSLNPSRAVTGILGFSQVEHVKLHKQMSSRLEFKYDLKSRNTKAFLDQSGQVGQKP